MSIIFGTSSFGLEMSFVYRVFVQCIACVLTLFSSLALQLISCCDELQCAAVWARGYWNLQPHQNHVNKMNKKQQQTKQQHRLWYGTVQNNVGNLLWQVSTYENQITWSSRIRLDKAKPSSLDCTLVLSLLFLLNNSCHSISNVWPLGLANIK